MRIAVVTPYFSEPREALERCHASVMGQTLDCTHLAVADGRPSPVFEGRARTWHMVLPAPNGDYGNTPRALGALFAAQQGFDAVAFLDADNWLDPDHLAGLVDFGRASGAALVACKRKFFGADGAQLAISERGEEQHLHVDTNCWLILRPAFALLGFWLMPRRLASVGDRLFLQKARLDGHAIGFSDRRSVCYRTRSAQHYAPVGQTPPAGAKTMSEYAEAGMFLLTPEGRAFAVANLGFCPEVNW